MATWVTSWASSQSRKAKSSAAVVPKVCTCSRVPFDPGTRTQAATVCLCTSSPHTRSISRSMVPPPRVVSPVPGGASFARLCSACSMATMRGADSSHVRLFADSRYQLQSTFPGIRRAVSIDDFHDARVCPRLMAIIFGLGLDDLVGAGGGLAEAPHREWRQASIHLVQSHIDLSIRQGEEAPALSIALDQKGAELLDLEHPECLGDAELEPVDVDDPLDAAPVRRAQAVADGGEA